MASSGRRERYTHERCRPPLMPNTLGRHTIAQEWLGRQAMRLSAQRIAGAIGGIVFVTICVCFSLFGGITHETALANGTLIPTTWIYFRMSANRRLWYPQQRLHRQQRRHLHRLRQLLPHRPGHLRRPRRRLRQLLPRRPGHLRRPRRSDTTATPSSTSTS